MRKFLSLALMSLVLFPSLGLSATATPTASVTPTFTAHPTATGPDPTPTPKLAMMFFHQPANGLGFYNSTTIASIEEEATWSFFTSGKLSKLFAQMSILNPTTSWDTTFRKNTINQTLTCTISPGTGHCSDESHSSSVAAQDVGVMQAPTGFTSVENVLAILTNSDNTPHYPILNWSSTLSDPAVNNFCTGSFGDSCNSSVASDGVLIPVDNEIRSFNVRLRGTFSNPGTTNTYTIGNIGTGLDTNSFVITHPNVYQETYCTTNCAVTAGDKIHIRVAKNAISGNNSRSITIEFAYGGQIVAGRAGNWTTGTRYSNRHTDWTATKAVTLYRAPKAIRLQNLWVDTSVAFSSTIEVKVCGGAGSTEFNPVCSSLLASALPAGDLQSHCTIADPSTCDNPSVPYIDLNKGDTFTISSDPPGTTSGSLGWAFEMIDGPGYATPTPTVTATPTSTVPGTATKTPTPTPTFTGTISPAPATATPVITSTPGTTFTPAPSETACANCGGGAGGSLFPPAESGSGGGGTTACNKAYGHIISDSQTIDAAGCQDTIRFLGMTCVSGNPDTCTITGSGSGINQKEFSLSSDSIIPDTRDVPGILANETTPYTITDICCFVDSGTTTINLVRNSNANISTLDITCGTYPTLACSTLTGGDFNLGENAIGIGDYIDFDLLTNSAAKNIHVVVEYTTP